MTSESSVAYEAEVLPGLAPFAWEELRALPGVRPRRLRDDPARADAIAFRAPPHAPGLHALRTVTAVHRRYAFEVPRPKALLGDAHRRRLAGELRALLRDAPMRSFRLRAAGRHTRVFERLEAALVEDLGLPHDAEGGELQLRVRRAGDGWEVLARITPRPLSARAWRVRNRAGGLNACVAAAGVILSEPRPGDRVLNLMCGGGTFLIERAAAGPSALLLGIDLDAGALDDARANLAAAGVEAHVRREDACAVVAEDGTFDALFADPPWGDAVGDHAGNARLYPALLAEAGRLAAPHARFVLVSHEIRVLEESLRSQATWRVAARHRVYHGGHRPALLLLERT